MKTKNICLTPGADWTFNIHPGCIEIKVRHESMRSSVFNFSKAEAQQIERELHDAIEGVISRLWTADVLEYAAFKKQEPK